MTSLFREISGGRPEHVAKGALVYLLRRDSNLMAWLATQCERAIPAAAKIEVMPEVPEGVHGWRADIVIEWSQDSAIAMELKLGAPLTPNQKEALAAGEVDLVIAAHRNLASIPAATKIVLWSDLIAHVSIDDVGAKAATLLLSEAAESYGWYLERISSADVLADAAAMFDNEKTPGRNERDWSQSYRFLVQIDAHLAELAPATWGYRPSASNMAPNRRYAHYGYYFVLGPKEQKASPDQWWIGLNRDDGVLALRLYANETEVQKVWSVGSDLHATAIASEILEEIKRVLGQS